MQLSLLMHFRDTIFFYLFTGPNWDCACISWRISCKSNCRSFICIFNRRLVWNVASPLFIACKLIAFNLSRQGFQTSMYASSWFLTLYTTALNLNLICCRIMDVFLSEGMEVIFKLALALLTIGKETVLSLDMEAMLKVIWMSFWMSRNILSFTINHGFPLTHLIALIELSATMITITKHFSTVFPKRTARKGRKRRGGSIPAGLLHQNQPEKDEKDGERLRWAEEKRAGGNGGAESESQCHLAKAKF